METAPGVISLCWCPSGRFLAWSCGDGRIRQWDNEESCILHPFSVASARYLQYSRPVAKLLAISDARTPAVRIVNASTGALEFLATSSSVDSNSLVLALTPPDITVDAPEDTEADKRRIPRGTYACASRSTVSVLRYSSELVASFSCGDNVVCAAFPPSDSSTPQRVATGEAKGLCRIWSLAGNSATCLLTLRSHSAWVTSLSFSADEGRRLASVSFDGTTKVWDATAKRSLLLLSIPRSDNSEKRKLHAVAYSPSPSNPSALSVAGADTVVRVWAAEPKGRQPNGPDSIALFRGHSKSVFALAFAPDGTRIASGSSDGYVRMWTLPAAPLVVSRPGSGASPAPQDTLAPPRLASRTIVFCPDDAKSLKCPICLNPYDTEKRRPYVSGTCGHTYACGVCNEKLFSGSGPSPRCPECRTELSDVAPNFELIRLLSPEKSRHRTLEANFLAPGTHHPQRAGGSKVIVEAMRRGAIEELARDETSYIALDRLIWVEAQESEVAAGAYTKTVVGRLDFEAVLIKVGLRFAEKNAEQTAEAKRRIENNIARLERLRGPHILQFYGASRTRAPDNRVLIVSEQMPGSSLLYNYEQFREAHCTVSVDTIVSLAVQLCRAVLFLHRSGVSRPSLEPGAVFLSHSLTEWSHSARLKLGDFGSSISRAGASSARSVAAMRSGAVAYLPPEALDPPSSKFSSDSAAFEHACRMDMYSLGVMIWELSSGTKPWDGLRGPQVLSAVVGRQDRPGFVPSHLPVEVRNVISGLWAQDPRDRLTAEQAVIALDFVPTAPPPPSLPSPP